MILFTSLSAAIFYANLVPCAMPAALLTKGAAVALSSMGPVECWL